MGIICDWIKARGTIPASTLGDVYKQVYTDLDAAIQNFKDSGEDWPADDNYSPNLNVAYAVYAKAALLKEDWQNAANYAVLAREGYPLMSNADYKDGGFNTVNPEWIWSCYNSTEQTLYFYSFFAYQASNSSASQCRKYPGAISKELYNKIPATDIRRQMFLVLQTGEDYNTSNEAAGEAMTARAKKEFGDKLYSTSQIYAYMQFKFQCTRQPGVGILNVFRSADMYLIQAEADCHIPGKKAEAQAILNELNKEQDPAYTCTKTGAALFEEVKLYRRIELWGEGSDWFDCKR